MRALLAVCGLVLAASPAAAETFRLRSGSTFEGTIVEQNDQEIVVEIPGLGRERIKRSELAREGGPAADDALAAWGVRFAPPDDWRKHAATQSDTVSFSVPGLAALTFRKFPQLASMHVMEEFRGVKVPVTLAGVTGSQIVEDGQSSDGRPTRMRSYLLVHRQIIYIISCAGARARFTAALQACDQALASLRFTGGE